MIEFAPEVGAQQLWRVRVHNLTSVEVRFQAFAVCATGFTEHRLIA